MAFAFGSTYLTPWRPLQSANYGTVYRVKFLAKNNKKKAILIYQSGFQFPQEFIVVLKGYVFRCSVRRKEMDTNDTGPMTPEPSYTVGVCIT